MIRASSIGHGAIPSGPITNAQARALLLADGSAADIGNALVARARCFVGVGWAVDAIADVSGAPGLLITQIDSAASRTLLMITASDFGLPGGRSAH